MRTLEITKGDSNHCMSEKVLFSGASVSNACQEELHATAHDLYLYQ